MPRVEQQYQSIPTIRRYTRELTRGASGSVLLNVALALAVAATEGMGLLLLLPLLEIAGVTADAGAVGDLPRYVMARLDALGVSASAAAALALYAAIMTVRAFLVRSSVVACVRLQERFLLMRRERLFRAMLGSRWERVAGNRSGALVHALTSDLENAADAPSHLLALFTGSLIALVYLGVAVQLSLPVTMLGAVGGTALLLILRRRRHAARRAAQSVDELTAHMFAATAEHVDGLKTTKAYGAERRSEHLFATQSRAVANANEQCEKLFANARTVLDVGAVIVLALAIYVAHDVLSLGTAAILVLLYIFGRVTPRLAGLQSSYQHLMLAMHPYARVMRAIDHWEAASEGGATDSAALRLQHALVLRAVHYRYPEPEDLPAYPDPTRELPLARPHALSDTTLTIGAGITTAVVGPSGAGKSTLADLVLGLLFPQEGRAEIDGVQLTPERAGAWRQRVGYVAQETHLFNDTIRANLLWARPDATEEDMRAALVQASAANFVDALPDGLDTVLGERGRSVSCGERQRLALARALLRRPELLVLDEATSSVDPENEREIQRAVESLKGRMTILIITHRLATTRAADVIHVMEQGRIVEIGTFEGLLRRGGRFAALCRAQGVVSASEARIPSAFPPKGDDERRQHTVRIPAAIEAYTPDLLPASRAASPTHNE